MRSILVGFASLAAVVAFAQPVFSAPKGLPAPAAESPTELELKPTWALRMGLNPEVMRTQRRQTQIIYVNESGMRYSVVMRPYHPVSEEAARIRMLEYEADVDSIKLLPIPWQSTTFVFRTKDQIHAFSTVGGHMTVTFSSPLDDAAYDRFVAKMRGL